MSSFFKRFQRIAHAASLSNRNKAEVSVASVQFAEIDHLLRDPLTDEDRALADQLRRVWLANHEAGC